MRQTSKLHEIEALLESEGWTWVGQNGAHSKWTRGSQSLTVAHHGKRSRLHMGQLRQQLRRLNAERSSAGR